MVLWKNVFKHNKQQPRAPGLVLSQLLKGHKVGQYQSAGLLSVYPLYSPYQEELEHNLHEKNSISKLIEIPAEVEKTYWVLRSTPGQVGALILLDGKLIGIERVGFAKEWENTWKYLLTNVYFPMLLNYQKMSGRTCSLQMEQVKKGMMNSAFCWEEMKEQIAIAEKKEAQQAGSVIRSLLKLPFQKKLKEAYNGFMEQQISSASLQGKAIEKDQFYFSISLQIVPSLWKRMMQQNSSIQEFKI